MNKLVTTSLVVALSGLFGAPQTVSARDHGEVAAAVGGFIGGLIVGSAVEHDRYDRHQPVYVRDRVVIESGRRHNDGYWQWTTVRVWVPGYWIVRYDDCGRRYRSFENGHFEHRRERVWVSVRGRDRRDDNCR